MRSIFSVLQPLKIPEEPVFPSKQEKTLMALEARSITRLTFSRLAGVSVCLFALVLMPLPQFALLTCMETAEGECPCHGDGESSAKELVVSSTTRRRANDRHRSNFSWSRSTDIRLHQIASYAGRLPSIVGHRLANGLRAPLLT
ncbi:MAG: hypothetical protein GXP26_18410 [Planctomycetes bacterium]|nr:hypothetical protein [Planctomycetota bacterium]